MASLFLMALAACAVQEIGHSSGQTIKVYKNAGAIQCVTAGVPVEVMEKTLTMNGIQVLSYLCGHDGYLRPATCGTGTGLINVYEIETQFLQKAIDLGFGEIGKLLEFRKTPCRDT